MNTTIATYQIDNTASTENVAVYNATSPEDAMATLVADLGYFTIGEAEAAGEIALDELAISSSGRVWTWKAGAWTLADDRREVDPALLGE